MFFLRPVRCCEQAERTKPIFFFDFLLTSKFSLELVDAGSGCWEIFGHRNTCLFQSFAGNAACPPVYGIGFLFALHAFSNQHFSPQCGAESVGRHEGLPGPSQTWQLMLDGRCILNEALAQAT